MTPQSKHDRKAPTMSQVLSALVPLAEAEKSGLVSLEYNAKDGWLSLYYKGDQNAEGKKGKWKLLCAQDIRDYCRYGMDGMTVDINIAQLYRRIFTMYAEKCRSLSQDIQCIQDDYTLTRK